MGTVLTLPGGLTVRITDAGITNETGKPLGIRDTIRIPGGRRVTLGRLLLKYRLSPECPGDHKQAIEGLLEREWPDMPIGTKEAGLLIGTGQEAVKKAVQRGHIRAEVIGHVALVPLADVLEYRRTRRGKVGRPARSRARNDILKILNQDT